MFTTLAHEAEYVFLLARTNLEVPKHKGLTIFIVPLDAPGIEIQPVHTLGGERTNITFYTDVRVQRLTPGRRRRRRLGRDDRGSGLRAGRLGSERGRPGVATDRRVGDVTPGVTTGRR